VEISVRIDVLQNEEGFLRLRAAIYRVYSRPKSGFTVLFISTLALAVVTTVNNLCDLHWDDVLGWLGVLAFLTDGLIRPWNARAQGLGASLSDRYDLPLYGQAALPRQDAVQITTQDIVGWAHGLPTDQFRNWYTHLDRFPVDRQPFVCQLQNSSWDQALRQHVVWLSLVALWVFSLGLLLLAGFMNLPFREALWKTFLPGVPFAFLLLRLHIDNRVSVARLRLLNVTLEAQIKDPQLATPAALLENQEALYRHRQDAFPIPNLFKKQLDRATAREVEASLQLLARDVQI